MRENWIEMMREINVQQVLIVCCVREKEMTEASGLEVESFSLKIENFLSQT
jgi:hypothetical protein